MMKKKSNISRSAKLNGEFQKAIYEIISRKIKNPFITEMFSILKVETSPDLKHATIFVSVYSTNEEKKQATFNGIKSEASKIRYELAHAVSHIRTVPELYFILDDSMEYGAKMDKLLHDISVDLQDKESENGENN